MKNNIAAIRNSKGIRQVDLAEMVGIKANSLNKIERGKRNPSIGMLQRIADELNVSKKDIFLD